jgi:Flp pilus assembly protein TadG
MSGIRMRWRRLSGGPDRGSSVIELAVLTPALMMLCMLILQFGLWFNARQVALASAQAGATVAREEANSRPGSWAGDAQAAAQNYYESLHTGLLTRVMPRAHGSPLTNVYVTVQGPLAYTVFPFFKINLTITETAGGPVECFRPAGQNEC